MDELDLVRLARPTAPELSGPDVAELRAAALGDVLDASTTSAGDAAPAAAVVDLASPPAAGGGTTAPGRRWRAALVGVVAAAVVLAGLALVVRRDAGGRDAGGRGAAGTDDNRLREAIQGWWSQTWEVGDTGGTIRWGGLTVSFVDAGVDSVLFDGPCGVFVSRRYRVEDARLVLSEPLTSPEGMCTTDRRLNDVSESVVGLLSSSPRLAVDADTLTIGGSTFRRMDTAPGATTTAAAQPTTTAAAPGPEGAAAGPFSQASGSPGTVTNAGDATAARP